VAQWRPSTTHGTDLDKRDRNLKICSSGIRDFGDNRGYTPIDLVMAAKACGLHEAVNWLDEKLGWSSGGPEIDLEAIRAKQEEQHSEQGAEQPKGTGQENEQSNKEKKRRIRLVPYELPDPAKIPRREWLYGYHYMRKIVSATIGPGGIGKSSLGLVEAISMAIGRDLLGREKLRRPLRVWYHNGEDSKDELDRRIVAICIHYKVDRREINGRLIVTCGLDMPIKVASGGNEVVLDKKLKAEITERIIEEKTDVEIFDPLVTLHNTTESLSSTMDPVIRDFFGVIANETDTGIELAHHTRKKATGQDEYTAADSRGSTTIVDAVRGMRITNQMSKVQAEEYGVPEDDREDYFRVTRGKVNMIRKAGSGKWYRFVTVTLPNGDPENDIPADDVGVLEAWAAPTGTGITQDDRVHFQTLVTDDPAYREDARAKHWIGIPIARRLRLNLSTPTGRKRAKRIFQALLDEGILAVREGLDMEGHTRNFVVSGTVPAEGLGSVAEKKNTTDFTDT
jgi:hypothetical protein